MARTYHAGPPAVRATEKELRIVGKAIKGAEWHLQGLVATLAMTGMRPGEWLGSNFSDKPQWIWKQVDLAEGRLHLPAVAHKTGQRPGKDWTIYLCKEAVKGLKAMPRDGDLILGGWQNGAKAWKDLRETCGLEHVQLYDLRHTFISNARRMVPNPVVSVLVDHADKTMDDVYSHDFEKELVTGAQKVGGFIAKLLGF